MAVDKLYASTLEKALAHTELPKINGKFGLTSVKDATEAVATAAKNAVDSLGQEILATYNKVKVYKDLQGNRTEVTSMLDGVKSETYRPLGAEERLIRYSRMSSKGTYTIDYDINGNITGTGITLPNGVSKYTPRLYGRPIKADSVENLIKLEKMHEATRGRYQVVDSGLSTTHYMGREAKLSIAKCQNGDTLYYYYDPKTENNFVQSIFLSNGDRVIKDLDAGVTLLCKSIPKSVNFYIPVAYHINPKTGERTETTVRKVFDMALNRDVMDVQYKFPSSSKIVLDDLKYEINVGNYHGNVEPCLIKGSFKSPSEGKVELRGNTLLINGEEQTGAEIHKIFERLAPKDFSRSERNAFILLFKNSLEKAGISKDLFLPAHAHSWGNM